ncbi:amino acid ABC transporter substrate-binding protein [Aliiglaciecola sp. CAU 1673]|uniref:amino acid ABC transporter substrate-binding protein n=1 Tax=Aliiglaciecola sp. CAU 1673 TaxID=3032595 RepID=UPI0023DA977B|nr:amino acid ABC transporter substrate-binding protein [Aliiglaciecola sp. CAU 1673]MDF2179331.1 amino acid ABC transporter substrate-binding protein [Aliiglaciecola sp. CAU 1673]
MKTNKIKLALALALLTAFMLPAHAAIWQIYYPRPLTAEDERPNYPLRLLSEALNATGVNYKLMPSERILLQSKALKQLQANREVNVVWSMTDNQREADLLPIRIPIYKGLVGVRLFLIKPEHEKWFQGIRSFEQLTAYRPVSGHDWPDTKILQANGLDAVTGPDYEQLFQMMLEGKADFFPRSVVEIWDEWKNQEQLQIESHLALYYPTATYYFVNKNNVVLANLIQSGLQRILDNGRFEALFMAEYAPMLEQAKMAERRIFTLDNPILPKDTPVADKRLWFDLLQQK